MIKSFFIISHLHHHQQITAWEESLEHLHATIFRLRCYTAAVDASQQRYKPNPQELLTHASRGTKQALSKIGLFSVTSFVSYTNTRNNVSTINYNNQDSKLLTSSSSTSKSNRHKTKNTALNGNGPSSGGGGGIKARLLSSLKIADDSVVSAIRSRHSQNNTNKQPK